MYRDQEFMENAWVFASIEARTQDSDQPRARRWMNGLAAVAIFIIAFFAASAFGQTNGRISGAVKDMTGAVIPNGAITATNLATGVRVSTVEIGRAHV